MRWIKEVKNIKHMSFYLLLLLFLSFLSFIQTNEAYALDPYYYVAMGDSITRGSHDDIGSDGIGYEPILEDLLTTETENFHTIINEGVSGDDSSDGLDCLPHILDAYPEATYFLVQYGTNDAWTPRPSGLDLQPGDDSYPGSFKDNMQQIITAIKNAGKIPYLAEVPIAFDPYTNLNPNLQLYNLVIHQLRTENSISVVPPPFYCFFESNPDQIADGLHPNGVGYQSMAILWRDALMNLPQQLATGDITGDGRAEIISTWDSGLWYWNVAASKWTQMWSNVPSGDIVAGDFTGDGWADVASCWDSGLWYQNGATLSWTKVSTTVPKLLASGDITGDGRAEIIGTWTSGIWYLDSAKSKWTKMYSSVPSGDIAAGDFTGDGKADVASCWSSGLWFQDGDTLSWTKVWKTAPSKVTCGDVTGDGRSEIIGTWSGGGIYYWDVAKSKWTKMWSGVPSGDIAAGDFTGDGKADVASDWKSGLWYQNGATLGWTKVTGGSPYHLTAGDVTGD